MTAQSVPAITGERPMPEIDTVVPNSAQIRNHRPSGKDDHPVDREARQAFRRLQHPLPEWRPGLRPTDAPQANAIGGLAEIPGQRASPPGLTSSEVEVGDCRAYRPDDDRSLITMRAIQVREFGGPEVLEPVELPDPVPGPGQVVVDVAVTDVIYLDVMRRSGRAGPAAPALPYVPGRGGAGRVLAVGEGVDPAWVGRRVVARTDGGYAERLLAAEEEIVEVPDGLGLREAAAVLHDGGTAVGLFEATPAAAHDWVLVTAAAGGAAHLLVQLAGDAGARVVAAARGERKLAMLRDLGAAAVVDYSEPGWPDRVREVTGGSGVDLVFDGAGGEYGRAAFDAVADGGRFVTYGSAGGGLTVIDPAHAAERNVTVHNPLFAGPPPDPATARARIARALELTAKGVLRPHIGAVHPLDQAAEAHRALEERRTLGRALLLVSG